MIKKKSQLKGTKTTVEQENAWKKAEKLITQNKAEDALLVLQELGDSSSHQTTLQLAGKATHKIAQKTNSKSDYRKAVSLLRESVKMNPKDKKSKRAHSVLLNEMQKKGIRQRSFRNVGYAIIAIATLLLIVGTIGISPEAVSRRLQVHLLPSRRALYFLAQNLSEAIPFHSYFHLRQL